MIWRGKKKSNHCPSYSHVTTFGWTLINDLFHPLDVIVPGFIWCSSIDAIHGVPFHSITCVYVLFFSTLRMVVPPLRGWTGEYQCPICWNQKQVSPHRFCVDEKACNWTLTCDQYKTNRSAYKTSPGTCYVLSITLTTSTIQEGMR